MKLRMVLMVEYRSSRLDQNKPFSGLVLKSHSFPRYAQKRQTIAHEKQLIIN